MRRGFDRPNDLARQLHARLSTRGARNANAVKWQPIIANAKTRKQPCGTGWRTEFTKRFAEMDMHVWAVIFEAIEVRAVPEAVRQLITCPFVMQLLKRDASRRFSTLSKTRPIGLTCSLTQDALRPRANRGAKVLACVLVRYGQMACGVRAGGEAAQVAAQARCDRSRWVVTVAIDYANAFGLVGNELTYHALAVCVRIIRNDAEVRTLLEAARISVSDAAAEVEFMMADLVWTRTAVFSNVTVVEGALRRLWPNMGETQGGLFSALRYVVAKAIAVDRLLAIEFPGHVMRSIADDGIMQVEVRTEADVKGLVKWMWRLDELARGANRPLYRDGEGEYAVVGPLGRLNFSKFKILQHAVARGTDVDIEAVRHRMPFECVPTPDGDRREYPTVVRRILEFNGVAIGFDDEARRAHVAHEVQLLDERAARLLDVAPILGRQRAEIYGRASYRPSSVLMHQMRANPPSVAMGAMGHATQLQLRLFRDASGATEEMVGGAMEE